ncbi:MAG: O-acetyl-ADP-ribose deacetylase [Bacteroidetes bacterium]|nr:O-acetyl-ADP-ribose deacetylase [Bacteroidota bacterium]
MNKIEVIQADITQLNVDAIVNAANKSLTGGGGVDGAIHRAAGIELLDACINLRGCETGQSKITSGYQLPAKFIIHTVGPVWYGGTKNEEVLLRSCYWTALELAIENEIKTIAFPAISTGAYRFPFDKAAMIAFQTVNEFLQKHDAIQKVFLVFYSSTDLDKFKRVIQKQNPIS